jgi:hypothetical protein
LSTDNLPRVSDSDNTIDSGSSLLDVQLLDGFFNPVELTAWSVNWTTGIISSNLMSSFKDSLDYAAYYIKYTVKTAGITRVFVDLLNNEKIFNLATFDDLDEFMNIIEGRKVYLEEEGDQWKITLPAIGTYAYQPTADARIRILPPPPVDNTDPWYVRVTDGRIVTNVNGIVSKYHIAEFLQQVFNPEPPIKKVDAELSTVLTTSLVKLDHENIYEDTDLVLYVDILIDDVDDNARAAFTTSPNKIGQKASNGATYSKWTYQNKSGIKSMDKQRGFVALEGIKLNADDKITSSYYYLEDHYEFNSFNFNPITNSNILGRTVSLFIDPDYNGSEKTKTLYYLVSDEAGKVIESDWTSFDNDTQTIVSDGEPMYYEAIPDFLQTVTPGEPDYLSSGVHLFIPEYSVTSSGVFLVLGDIETSEASSIGETTLYDTRLRGGGIRDDSVDEARDLYPEVDWYWDKTHWDGTPYPGNASYFVEVPAEILEGAGGRFKSHEIRDIVMRHTAAGVYPVVKSYGVDITLSGIEPSASGITLTWISNGY